MKSKTKLLLDESAIVDVFRDAGIEGITSISALGAGEYNAVFAVTTPEQNYAMKIAPPSGIEVLSYEKDLLQSEIFWYDQISRNTSIRVPRVFYSDFSRKKIESPYFIMELLDGEQLNLMNFTEHERNECIAAKAKMAAQIHEITNDCFGYIQNGLKSTWYDAITSMVESLISDCHRLGKESLDGERLLRAITANKEILEKAECVMVNFDLWDSNVLCSRENGQLSFAWIDPERSFWGDRIADFVSMSRDSTEPLSLKSDSLKAYNSVAKKPVLGTREEDIRYAVALGYLALIQETEKYVRYEPGDQGWTNSVNDATNRFAAAFRILG